MKRASMHAIAMFVLTLVNPSAVSSAEPKLIQMGWDTPTPTEAAKVIDAMQKVPFDGVVFQLTANGHHDTTDAKNRMQSFVYRCWGKEKLKADEFSEAIDAMKKTKWGRLTDNFLNLWTKPGTVDWFSDDYDAVIQNAALLARAAKETGCKGILFDTEMYTPPVPVWSFKPDNPLKKTFAEYQQQVRKRGREFMQAVNKEYPDITIMLTFGYSQAFEKVKLPKFGSLEKVDYALLPSFLDGMLEAATPETIIYDGWEDAYAYKGEAAFVKAREKILVEGLEKWTALPEKYRKQYRASFGLWVDLDYGTLYPWDVKNFARNYFTPEEFAFSLHSAFKHTDRYVWIWSQKIAKHGGWFGGRMPQPYLDALTVARGDNPALYHPFEECFDYVGHQAAGSTTASIMPYKGNQKSKPIGVNLALSTDDYVAGAAAVRATWIADDAGPSPGGIEKGCGRSNLTGKRFSVWTKVLTPDTIAELSVALIHMNGKEVERHTWTGIPTDWKQLEFTVGKQGEAEQLTRDVALSTDEINRIVFYGVTKTANQRAVVLWDDFTELHGSEKPITPKRKPAKRSSDVSNSKSDNPVGWWKFTEETGDVLSDSSPNANHGKINGAKWTKGPGSASALAFQPGAWVEFPQQLKLADAATIMFWVKFDAAIAPGKIKGYPTLLSYGIDGDFSYNVTLHAGSGKLSFSASFVNADGSRGLRGVQSVRDNWDAGSWHHVAVTCDPVEHQMAIYVDGALHDTAKFDGPIHPGNAKSKLYLGLPSGWGYGHVAPSAAMSDVRIYKLALPAAEVAAIHRTKKLE